ncbi:hypothetical protein BDV26DRAFT_261864 [Aspergillus bertholletiae]|uniref:Xylanolytic transcriptional activator regulatory domain-containing protein n=1 Tax=Aspergillus bertholletiae TaxID=1226010 RepID=A0A5N7B911_9EURO|nr:hypothetical protein BDV26DRAFT_261864 [Aspergillus bertholletiae]
MPAKHNTGEQSKSGRVQLGDALHYQNPVAGLDKSLLERAFYAFIRHFPEFNFFHQPSFLIMLDKQRVPVMLLCSILALTSRFVPEIASQHGSSTRASKVFANYVRQSIMSHTAVAMDIFSCQALVLLCLYEWGEGNGSRAWIHNGMASRIAHGVHARAKDLAAKDNSASEQSRLEEARRTVWACFLIDAMIGCGKCQASNYSMSVREVSLPLGEDDFAFGNISIADGPFLNLWDPETEGYCSRPPYSLDKMGCDRSLALIIQGFHIWHTISAWVSAGGRKRESPASKEPPWRESSFCARCMAALEDWRASQHPQLVYSASSMNFRVYISRGEGERFAVINLLYYLSVIFLHREYSPFAMHVNNCYADHIDPTPPDEAPHGWWEQKYQVMFAASSNIIMIMQELDQRGIYFQTPFSCFCVFTAATWLLYVARMPHMVGLEAQPKSSLLSWASAWLNRACKVWKLACGWYRTLLALSQLFTQFGMEAVHQVSLQSDSLPTLEENMQRLAGSETAEPEDVPTANILLLLQRQQKQFVTSSEPRMTMLATDTDQTVQAVGDSNLSMSDDLRPHMGAETPLLSSSFHMDQDLLTNILGDFSGNWLRPFVDAEHSLGE